MEQREGKRRNRKKVGVEKERRSRGREGDGKR